MSEERDYEEIQSMHLALKSFGLMRDGLRTRALDPDYQPALETTSLVVEVPEYPRIPSGIAALDEHNGGWQGVSLITGKKGCGKSTLAMSCALYAAHAGFCVVYLEAENGSGLQRKRIKRWYGDKDFHRFTTIAGVNFHYVRVRKGNDLGQVARLAVESAQDFHLGMMLVLDSTDAIVRKLLRRGENKLDRKSHLLTWLDEVGQESQGRVASLCISEQNKEGEVKGLEAAYTAWVELKLERDGRRIDAVNLSLEKDRDAESPKDLGSFIRDSGTTSFIPYTWK
jgi:hypothetical protein